MSITDDLPKPQHKNTPLDRLPSELRFYIAEFVPSTPDRPLPYIREYKDVLVDWYNKVVASRCDTVYQTYSEIVSPIGITEEDTVLLKYGFFYYSKDVQYYRMTLCSHTGQFKKLSRRRILSSYGGEKGGIYSRTYPIFRPS